MILNMTRTGAFSINAFAHRDNNCGMPFTSNLAYKVELEIMEDHLDKETGFIIDNNAVQEYFNKTYARAKKFRSCELIAIAACRHFRRKIKGLRRVAVSISGNPAHAWLTSSWCA